MRRLLMVPGPSEVSFRIIQACVCPSISHLDPEFIEVMDETCRMLGQIFQTKSEIIPLFSSGRGGIEAALASSLESGERVLVVSNGVFCNMITSIAKCVGIMPIVVKYEPGKKMDLTKIEDAIKKNNDVKAIAAVHSETSTGMLNPAQEIGEIAKEHNLIYILDCVSSLGGVDVRPDEWGVDICITGSQKALGSLPGLAILSVSGRMWDIFEKRKTPIQSFYFDLSRWKSMWIPKERGGKIIYGYRRMPVTASTHLIYALHEACKMILEEGLSQRFERHQRIAKAVREALKRLGIKIFPEPGLESPTLTAFLPPRGARESDIRKIMKQKYGIAIADGLEEFHGKMLRIGHMGNTASMEYIVPTVAALELTLRELGVNVEVGAGVNVLLQFLEKAQWVLK